MNKLLFTFILFFAGTGSLHGMELEKKLSSITLPQIYQCFSETLPKDIIRYIFSLQMGDNNFAERLRVIEKHIEQNSESPENLVQCIEGLMPLYGYLLVTESCESFLKRNNISICGIRDKYKKTCLHRSSSDESKNQKVAQMFIQISGKNRNKLLTMRDTRRCTALHIAALYDQVEIVKLILDAADDKNKLFAKKDMFGKTAIYHAKPEVIEVLQTYMTNKKQKSNTTCCVQ